LRERKDAREQTRFGWESEDRKAEAKAKVANKPKPVSEESADDILERFYGRNPFKKYDDEEDDSESVDADDQSQYGETSNTAQNIINHKGTEVDDRPPTEKTIKEQPKVEAALPVAASGQDTKAVTAPPKDARPEQVEKREGGLSVRPGGAPSPGAGNLMRLTKVRDEFTGKLLTVQQLDDLWRSQGRI
jgi:hypothetical protein